MTPEREQEIRALAEVSLLEAHELTSDRQPEPYAGVTGRVPNLAQAVLALLAELATLRAERDEAAKRGEYWRERAIVRAAEVAALREALEWLAENAPHQAGAMPHDGCTPCFAAFTLARTSSPATEEGSV